MRRPRPRFPQPRTIVSGSWTQPEIIEPGRHLIPSLPLRVLTRRTLADARASAASWHPSLLSLRSRSSSFTKSANIILWRSIWRNLETEAYASNENITPDVTLPGGLLVIDDSIRDERRGATPPPAQPAGRKSESRKAHWDWNCCGRRSGRSN